MRVDLRGVEDASKDGGGPPPPGIYDVVVTECNFSRTSSGKDMLTVRLRVTSGEWEGRTFRDRLFFTPAALPRLKMVLDRMGFDTDAESIEVTERLLVDRTARVEVEAEVYTDAQGDEKQGAKVPYAGWHKGAVTESPPDDDLPF